MISGKKKGQQFSTIDETENQSLVELFVWEVITNMNNFVVPAHLEVISITKFNFNQFNFKTL